MKLIALWVVATFSITSSYSQHFAYAQELTPAKYFYTNDGEQADEARANYYSIRKRGMMDSVSRQFIDTVLSFYLPSNAKKSKVLLNQNNILHGNYVHYHENGEIKEIGNYVDGKYQGQTRRWYANGMLHLVLNYVASNDNKNVDEFIITYLDSLGKQLVSKGDGYCKCYLNRSDTNREEGKVVGGLKDSVWLGFENNILIYQEEYSQGVLLKGISYSKGKTFPYTTNMIAAEYPSGMKELYRFLSKNIEFPAVLRREKISGKIFIQFIVEVDGSLTNVKIIKPLHESADQEAIRLVNLMPKWIPGKVRGVPAPTKFILPLTFKIER